MKIKLGNRELIIETRKVPDVPVRRHDIPVKFKCYKCKKVNSTELENIHETVFESEYAVHYAASCQHCTSLDQGSELATTNMIWLTKETFEKGQPSKFPSDHGRI